MKIRNITENKYQEYIDILGNSNFLQTAFEGRKLASQGWEVEYISILENDKMIGAAMLTYIPLMKLFKYCYIPRGMFIDYKDASLVTQFTKQLKLYLKNKNVIYLEIDPYIPLRQHDKNGNVINDGWNNFDIVENLKKAGFIGFPLKYGYDETKQCRWMSVLKLNNLTKDEVYSNFSSHTKRNINISKKNDVKIKYLTIDDLSILDEMEKKTAERQRFQTMPLSYYLDLYTFFGDRIKTLYAYINIEEYEKKILKEIAKYKKEKNKLMSIDIMEPEKLKKRTQEIEKQISKLEKKHEECERYRKVYIEDIPLACCLYIESGKEIVYLIGASNYDARSFRGPYAIHWQMIQEAIEDGFDFYNFYGISGLFEKNQDGYGVFDFKRGFNSDVVELIGNYILPVNDVIFNIYNRLKHIA